MRGYLATGFAVSLSCVMLSVRPVAAASCDNLASLALPKATITLANLVDAGAFVPFPQGRVATPAPVPPARGAAAPGARGAGPDAGAAGARGRGGRGG
ncbi:MAG: hypothetical protein ABJA98_18125, partial [Acidobacteriota bacterium]